MIYYNHLTLVRKFGVFHRISYFCIITNTLRFPLNVHNQNKFHVIIHTYPQKHKHSVCKHKDFLIHLNELYSLICYYQSRILINIIALFLIYNKYFFVQILIKYKKIKYNFK